MENLKSLAKEVISDVAYINELQFLSDILEHVESDYTAILRSLKTVDKNFNLRIDFQEIRDVASDFKPDSFNVWYNLNKSDYKHYYNDYDCEESEIDRIINIHYEQYVDNMIDEVYSEIDKMKFQLAEKLTVGV